MSLPPAIFNKDLLATLHLLLALAKRFQADLPLPPNVQVEVITMEVRAGPGLHRMGPHSRPGLADAAGGGAEPSVFRGAGEL